MEIWNIDQLTSTQLDDTLNKGDGFVLSSLCDGNVDTILALVREQYLHVIQMVKPDLVANYSAADMQQYHAIYQDNHFGHSRVWSKAARMLGPKACQEVLTLSFIDKLKKLVGSFLVSDEEGFGWPGIYWRLVRPGSHDVGPIHADKWFWDLGHGQMPEGYRRVKLWICLRAQKGKSGLRVVPGSQLKDDWKYHGENRNGMKKPVLDENEADLDLVNLPLSSGQFVLFHDKLLHGGMTNTGDASRISLELTLLIPQ